MRGLVLAVWFLGSGAATADSATDARDWVLKSDDFAAHSQAFAEAAVKLAQRGTCSAADFIEAGGSIKSTNKGAGYYFTYCGGFTLANRIYLHVPSGGISR